LARASSIPGSGTPRNCWPIDSQFGIDAKAMGADPAALNHDQLAEALRTR